MKDKTRKQYFNKYFSKPAIAFITAWGMTNFYRLFGWDTIPSVMIGYITAYFMYEVLNK